MQQIKVRYENGVFVPLEPIKPGFFEEEIVRIEIIKTKKGPVTREKSVATDEYRARAKAYIEENFPDVEVSQEIMNLIGILQSTQCDDYKSEYNKYLEEKYGD
jgi:predicted DNA-binding antitoxin AbrB/MazE fold protein